MIASVAARRRPTATTLAEHARVAVVLFEAARQQDGADIVTTRGIAIEACLEAAYADKSKRARWTLETERIRDTAPELGRGQS